MKEPSNAEGQRHREHRCRGIEIVPTKGLSRKTADEHSQASLRAKVVGAPVGVYEKDRPCRATRKLAVADFAEIDAHLLNPSHLQCFILQASLCAALPCLHREHFAVYFGSSLFLAMATYLTTAVAAAFAISFSVALAAFAAAFSAPLSTFAGRGGTPAGGVGLPWTT